MPAEIVHQGGKLVVGALVDEQANVALIADRIVEALAPGRPAGKHQRGVKRVRTIVDPLTQLLATRLLERGLLQRPIFQYYDIPAEIPEQLLVALPQSFADDSVEALPVVVNNPPAIAQPLLPALEQRLENIALVELSVADQRHHTPFRPIEA